MVRCTPRFFFLLLSTVKITSKEIIRRKADFKIHSICCAHLDSRYKFFYFASFHTQRNPTRKILPWHLIVRGGGGGGQTLRTLELSRQNALDDRTIFAKILIWVCTSFWLTLHTKNESGSFKTFSIDVLISFFLLGRSSKYPLLQLVSISIKHQKNTISFAWYKKRRGHEHSKNSQRWKTTMLKERFPAKLAFVLLA